MVMFIDTATFNRSIMIVVMVGLSRLVDYNSV